MKRLIVIIAVCAVLAFGQLPKTGSVSAGASGGAVGGASGLPTVGAVPVVTAPGVLGPSAIVDDGTDVTITGRNIKVGTTVFPLGTVDVRSQGAVGNGTTDDYAALMAAHNAAKTAGHCVYLPAQIFAFATPISLSDDNTCWVGEPGTVLKYTGSATAAAWTFNGTPGKRLKLNDITLDGGSATDGFLFILPTGFELNRLRVTHVAGAGVHCQGCTTGTIRDLIVSGSVEAFGITPVNGFLGDTATANVTILTPKIERVSGAGISCTDGVGLNIIGGTSEANGTGIYLGATPLHTVSGIDLEANSVADITCAGCYASTFTGIIAGASADTSASLSLTDNARSNVFTGGRYKTISLDGSTHNNSFHGVSYTASFTDSGVNNSRYGIHNGITDALLSDSGNPVVGQPSNIDTVVEFDEEFLPNATTTGNVGQYGWNNSAIVGAVTAIVASGYSNPNIGAINIGTPGTTGQGTRLALDWGGEAVLGNLSTSSAWDSRWIFTSWYQGPTAGQLRIGYFTSGAAAIPTTGMYLRYDTTLKNVVSATCNDAGNKCGLTALTCSAADTVTFSINGGTATGSVACTGSNAIDNSTAITVIAGGTGYNSAGGAAVGAVTGGTAATKTGAVALTATLGAVNSGPDSTWMFCSTTGSLESCYQTAATPSSDGTMYKVRIRQISSGKIGLTLNGPINTTTELVPEKTICASSCDVTAAPPTSAMVPGALLVAGGDAAIAIALDAWKFKMWDLAR